MNGIALQIISTAEMTAQINDRCFHRGIDFALAGISGTGLFDPESTGIKPSPMTTACWRGYVAGYTISDGELFLVKLTIGFSRELAHRTVTGGGPELFGVLPNVAGSQRPMGFCYEGFQFPIPFTGGLLLADDFIKELYVHMGFHPAWKYRNVREVIFDSGRVLEDHDRSSEMADVRARALADIKNTRAGIRDLAGGDIQRWIERCFSREY